MEHDKHANLMKCNKPSTSDCLQAQGGQVATLEPKVRKELVSISHGKA